jgi:thioredoxin reductase (NADPH)/glutaredoxin 3
MEITPPDTVSFTVYSKSGCPHCRTVKNFIKDKHFFVTEINCDEYLLENKDAFLTYIEELAGKSYKSFPMVFYRGKFVGGLTETIDLLDKILLLFDGIF